MFVYVICDCLEFVFVVVEYCIFVKFVLMFYMCLGCVIEYYVDVFVCFVVVRLVKVCGLCD